MKSDNKQRINIWLPPSLLAQMDSQLVDTDSRNRSEYTGKAIDFYAGFIASEGTEDYISKTLLAKVDKRLKQNESHISKTLFKLAVEIAMSLHVTASLAGIDKEEMPNLHKRCINEVKASLGRINFQTIYEEYDHE